MKIKTEFYCTLASHPVWQQWLRDIDEELYGVFIEKYRASKSCQGNARIMIDMLPEIEAHGLKSKLLDFLVKHFPNTVVRDGEDDYLLSIEKHFISQTLTFPRRIILTADGDDINKTLLKFLDGKIKYEYAVVSQKAYVEYLNAEDSEVQDKIPDTKWLLKRIKK